MASYVNNKDFYDLMLDYHQKKEDAMKNGKKLPKPSDEIGKNILLICKNIMKRWNFSRYTWKDEMEETAICDCCAAIDKFDPTRFRNPFAYFTQVAYFAAIRVITQEAKQSKIKLKLMENANAFELDDESKITGNNFDSINSDDLIENRSKIYS